MSDRDTYRELRARQQTIRDAAAALRHDAVQDQYGGATHPEFAFGMASILDTVVLQYADLPREVRDHAAGLCVWMMEERADRQGCDRTE